MSVKIRLMRMGKRKQPTYRVVVADSRSPRNGRFIEILGQYQPRSEPSEFSIDEERALHWLKVGARPTEQVSKLLEAGGLWDRFESETGRPATTKAKISTRVRKPKNAAPESEAAPSDAAGENDSADSGADEDGDE